MSSQAPALKAAFVSAIGALSGITGTDVLVCYGEPGKYQPDDIIAVTDVSSSHELQVIAPTRPREETLTVTVVVSCYRGGDDPTGALQQIVTERAYALLGLVEDYVKVTDPSIGGTVRSLTGPITHDLVEGFSVAADGMNVGRIAEITATFTLFARW